MQKRVLFILIFGWGFLGITYLNAKTDFVEEAKNLAKDLKGSLVTELSKAIQKKGVDGAVPFCHANVGSIAKGAGGDRLSKFEIGRTSHKVRNPSNEAEPWMRSYLDKFKGKFKGEMKKDHLVHRFENGKRAYIEPLYVKAKCLLCHGENVSAGVKQKISALYPDDQATGFKMNEFRGFIWIKER